MADFDARGNPQALRALDEGWDHRSANINAPVITVTEVLSLRTPQYGLPLVDRHACLADALPNGESRWIALFSVMPSRAGVGGTEASGSGYARVEHTSWRPLTVGGFIARRANVGEVVFPTLTDDLKVIGWGAYDAEVDGNLRAFGLLRNVDGKARTFELGAGDDPTFLDGELQVGIQ